MPSTSDGSTPGPLPATSRLFRSETRPKTPCHPVVDDQSDLLACLPPADDLHRMFVDAAAAQQEQMDEFLRQQTTQEDVSL